MASIHKSLYINAVFTFFFALLCSSHAYNFKIGGKDGWTLHPSESYNQWSGRMRFLINDTLHFKYNSGSDSVLVVNKGDYDSCNTNNPITTLTGGDSFINLNRSGPFYFISGNKTNCDQGQKLIVVVLSPKKRLPPAGAPAPAMSSLAPIGSSVSAPPESGASIAASPVAGPDGGAASPTDMSAPAPASVAARPAVCATLSVLLGMILIFGFGLVC
uniref:early nodulin-like protein 2 n=1 Tax=Erigeron canadensis TaxID=72917 RepID=UPI001CB922EE|nr:early nodulin-like protein 2 [Erigeron canadensis]